MPITVSVVSGEAELFHGNDVTLLVAVTVYGEVGIKPGHAPMLAMLKPGQLRLERTGAAQHTLLYLSGGFLEVQPREVVVLADTAVRAQDVDEAAALDAKQRAEAMLTTSNAAVDYARARAELAKAVAQLAIVRRLQRQLER